MNLLEELIKAKQDPRLPGPLNALPTGVKQVLAATSTVGVNPLGLLATMPGQVGQGLADRAMDNPLGKAATGATLTGAGRVINDPRFARANQGLTDFIPLLALADKLELDRAAQRADFAQTTGNPLDQARQANEAGARGAEMQVGALNAVIDPVNLLGPLSKIGRLGKIAEIAGALDRAQALPFEAGARGVSRAARPVLDLLMEQRAAKAAAQAGEAATGIPKPPIDLDALTRYSTRALRPEVGPMLPERGNVPRKQLIPGIGINGRKGIGPIEPPGARVPFDGPQARLPEPIDLPTALATRKPLPTRIDPTNERVLEYLARRRPSAPLTPDGNTGVPTADRLRDFLRAEEARVGTVYQPNDPAYFQKRAGVDPGELPGALRQLVDEGTLGDLGDEGLALRPRSRATSAPLRGIPDLPDVDPNVVPDDALSAADEAAAIEASSGVRQFMPGGGDIPDLPGTGGVGDLLPDEIEQLLNVAYPNETAIGNAIAKRTDPTDLTNRAIERITTTPNLSRELGERYPELAEKIAHIDLPGEKAAPLTPAQMARDEFYEALDAQPITIDPTTRVEDWGQSSGKRLGGGQVRGGMSDPPRGTKTYTNPYGNLPEAGDSAAGADFTHLNDLGTEAQNAYLRARSMGLDHDAGMVYVYELTGEATPGTTHTRVTTPASRSQGGDIAAGGGMGITIPRPLQTLTGAALGGATGAVAGALADDEDRLRGASQGALAGATLGGSLGSVSPEIAQAARQVAPILRNAVNDTALDPGMWEEAIGQGIQDQIASQGNKGVRGGKASWDSFWQYQRSQVVNTLKQIPQDAFTQLVTRMGIAGREFGITDADIRRMQGVLRSERQVGGSSNIAPTSSNPALAAISNPTANPVSAQLLALGNKNALLKPQEYFGLDYGASLAGDQAEFKAGGRVASGLIVGGMNAVKGLNPFSLAYGMARGYVAPFVDGVIRYVNGIQHDAFRYAMVEKGLGREIPAVAGAFLDGLDGRGVDTTALRASGGFFSADQVRAVAGAAAAKEWDWLQETTVRRVGDRVAFLAGDFRDKLAKDYGGKVTKLDKVVGHFEKGVGRYVPFVRWQIRYAPVLAEIAARNPLATLYAVKGVGAGIEDAKENNLKSYQAGTIPITTETPLVGGLARARLGGQQGTVRIDPMGMVNPYGAGTIMGDELPEDPTLYQRATNAASRIGFSPAPPIQAAAYVTGLDYKAPSALSRTAGLEGLADVPPIVARAILSGLGRDDIAGKIPDLNVLPGGGTVLERAREIVTGGNANTYDPVARRYAELVLRETGKPLEHKDNRAYLEAVGNSNEPLWERATIDQRLGAAANNATGMVSPVYTQAQTTEATAAQAAGKLPYTVKQIIDAPSEAIKTRMEQANAAAIRIDPRLGTYQSISGGGRKRALVDEWKRQNQGLKRIAPSLYQERLKAYEDSIK